MTCYSERLTSQLPRCRWSLMIVSGHEGWYVEIHHAHVGGLLVDCPSERYGPMTFAELDEVIASLVALMPTAPGA